MQLEMITCPRCSEEKLPVKRKNFKNNPSSENEALMSEKKIEDTERNAIAKFNWKRWMVSNI